MKKVNIHIYQSSFKFESRILKETRSLTESNLVDEIHILSTWEPGLPEHEIIDNGRQVWRVKTRINHNRRGKLWILLRIAWWHTTILAHYLLKPIKLVNCHSILVLPLGVLLKLLSGAKLAYDTHELETESSGASGMWKRVVKVIERSLIPFIDVTITVNESISEWYRRTYGLKTVYTVRNIPYAVNVLDGGHTSYFRRKFGLCDDDTLFLYTGGLYQGRGIDILLETFSIIAATKHIVFMGFGDRWQEIVKGYESRHPNIHYHEAVKPDDVFKYASGADVGIALIENTCLSYYLSLPNKVFEYLMSGLPIIVSDFPEMHKIVEDGKCGWAVEVNENALSTTLNAISPTDILEKKKNVLEYRSTLGWHIEETFLIDAYKGLL